MENSIVKRLLALILAASMSFSIAGCSSKENTAVTKEQSISSDAEASTEGAESSQSVEMESESEENKEETTSKSDESTETYAPDTSLEDELLELETLDDEDELTETQRNAINMLNYMTVLTKEINESTQSRVFLDNAYDSLINNTYPNAVDSKTLSQITSMLDTLHQYQMINEKRDRLEYIYEQNQAQALREAIPSPLGLLSVVKSGSFLKAAASAIYMAVDAVTSYESASSQAELEYLKEGWELDDEEAEAVHKSRSAAFTYMVSMVNDNGLPGDYALTEDAVKDYVEYKNKTNLVSKISWFESNEETYKEFGPYWLELAKDYYDAEEYQKCLDAFEKYEQVTTRIFRKDTDYADALPMAIISAEETMSQADYNEYADKYAQVILKNTDDCSLNYFVAQVYIDLYKNTNDKEYLEKAYDIAFDNVNELVDEQKELNETYIADVQETKAEEGATKRQKEEVKQYNKMLKEKRKVELPPVNEALYLNCDLLFALAEELGISSKEQGNIEAILHENGENIFLTTALDNRFRLEDSKVDFDVSSLNIQFTGTEISIPASCVTDRSTISVVISGASGETMIDDWTVKSVTRPKNSEDVSEFTVKYESETAKNYKYADGDSISINVVPVAESSEEVINFKYKAVQVKKLLVFNDIKFERE